MSVKEKTQVKNKKRFNHCQWLIKYSAVLFTIICGLLVLFTIIGVNQYAGFSRRIFKIINWAVLILLLITYYLLWRVIVNRMKKTLKYLSYILLLEFIIGLVGSILVFRVNSNVNKMINSKATQTIETALVVENGEVSSFNDLSNTIVGLMDNNLGNDDMKKKISNNSKNVTYLSYNTYSEILTALSNDQIHGAILPKEYKGMFDSDSELYSLVESTDVLDTVTTQVESSQEDSNNIDVTTQPFTVLIAGIDEERSDAIMVASFNPQSLRLTLTSIPRDSYVEIACYVSGQKGKLGHARATSRDCMIDTIENLLDINIDFYFESNFKGVVDIVDAIGGITINSSKTFMAQNSDSQRGHYTVQIFEGENRLDGEQALAYARERHAYDDGDFSRQQNQQQVISAIMTQALRIRDLNTMLKVLDAAGENISTNFSIDQLTDLFNLIMKKSKRFLYSDEHIEKIIQIENSRITAYNSYYWDEANYTTVSVVQLYDTSINAVKEMINENLRSDESKTYGTDTFSFDASIEFNQPTISYDTYENEPEKVPQVTESYFCYITNGTWNNGACTCYGGTTFVKDSGCRVTTSNSTNKDSTEN